MKKNQHFKPDENKQVISGHQNITFNTLPFDIMDFRASKLWSDYF